VGIDSTDCIGSCKSNYHMITATTAPENIFDRPCKCNICQHTHVHDVRVFVIPFLEKKHTRNSRTRKVIMDQSHHSGLGNDLLLNLFLQSERNIIMNMTDLLSVIYVDRHVIRRVWICKRGHQNPYIEEEQTTQWPKEKVQKDKQRSTKYTHKTKDLRSSNTNNTKNR
jgi:hypothetical protein